MNTQSLMPPLMSQIETIIEQMDPIFAHALCSVVDFKHFNGQLSTAQMAVLINKTNGSESKICLTLLPIAATFAIAPISNFNVGAIVKGGSGTFYFGANIEFKQNHLGQTIHAEQSAITHAWGHGEHFLTELYVTDPPCGHCRQFINELNSVEKLMIQLPKQAPNPLSFYLPNAFGPSSLNVKERLLNSTVKSLPFNIEKHHIQLEDQPLVQQALIAASKSYAPYSKISSGIAIELNDGSIIHGSYAENAAFNPSLPPLQGALILMQMRHQPFSNIRKAILIETENEYISHYAITKALLAQIQATTQLQYYKIY